MNKGQVTDAERISLTENECSSISKIKIHKNNKHGIFENTKDEPICSGSVGIEMAELIFDGKKRNIKQVEIKCR